MCCRLFHGAPDFKRFHGNPQIESKKIKIFQEICRQFLDGMKRLYVHMHDNFAQTSCLKLAVHMCHFPKDQVVGLKPSLRKIRSMCTGLSTQSEE
ncbi:hypothetical protein M8J77_020190 [Diaphorina citri]|nr:hypothetical protein M8J77_020190 [Diaphorina citri]